MKIIINDIPPSNNQYMGNSRSYHIYGNKKKEWLWKIKCAIKHKPEKPYKYSDVTITYFFKDRRRHDPDNYSGKFILDALRECEIIEDDSFDNINLTIRKGGVDKLHSRTEIEIREIEVNE